MKDRTCWFLKFYDDNDPQVTGIGECAPLSGLSRELEQPLEERLTSLVDLINNGSFVAPPPVLDRVNDFVKTKLKVDNSSSILFALETGLLDLAHGGTRKIFDSKFLHGQPIPINGLIWMGGMDFMLQQIEIKIRDGFRCIKLKVGGLDFEKECDILQYVRRKYFRDNIVIRLDANGAFKPDDALYKLKELSKFSIQSIEQPIKQGSDFLPELCATSPIPVALDEELIGVEPGDRQKVLQRVKPPFIVLKPTLHGGFTGVAHWIAVAEKMGIGWWITSGLESNIGLNALAQFTSQFNLTIPQGLGTGMIYNDNIASPLTISGQNLTFDPAAEWAPVPEN